MVSILLRASLLIVLTFSLAGQAHAFRSTKQESFTDPDYVGYKPGVVVVSVLTDNFELREVIEERVLKDLRKKGLTVYSERDLFVPTRQWDAEQRAAVLAERHVDAMIVVGIGASSHDVSQIGTNTYTTVNAYGYGNSATAYGSSTSVPIVSAKSKSSFSAVLIDVTNGRTAWTTDIFTKAGGLLFAGGKKDAKAGAKAVIKGLTESGHLATK
jgi:hypothetical protein